jgi:hypothetical protein
MVQARRRRLPPTAAIVTQLTSRLGAFDAGCRRVEGTSAEVLRWRPRLNIHRNDHQHDHQKRTSRKHENHAGDAHEDVVPACLSSPFLQREPAPRRTIPRGRIVQARPGHASGRAIEIDHRVSRHFLQQAYCYAECRDRPLKTAASSHHGAVRPPRHPKNEPLRPRLERGTDCLAGRYTVGG